MILLSVMYVIHLFFMIAIITIANNCTEMETFVFQDGNLVTRKLSDLPIVQNIGKEVDGGFLQIANANVICGVQISLGIIFASLFFLTKKLLSE